VFAWIIIAYVLGHVSGQISSTLLEKGLVKRGLGYPSSVLFRNEARDARDLTPWQKRLKWLFPGYFEPLPKEICDIVRKNVKKNAGIARHSARFMYCDARVKRNDLTAAALTIFLGLYGFARNVCIASAAAAGLLVVGAIAHHENWDLKLWLAGAAVVIAVFLLYRYLKFLRVYALEMFSAYAASYPPEKAA
jgi:hypothetical protein